MAHRLAHRLVEESVGYRLLALGASHPEVAGRLEQRALRAEQEAKELLPIWARDGETWRELLAQEMKRQCRI